jgi:hypothetical protein
MGPGNASASWSTASVATAVPVGGEHGGEHGAEKKKRGGGSKDSATSINVLVDGTMEYDGYINVGITLTLPSTANATSVALSNCSLEAVLPQVRGGGERDEWI